MIDTSSPDWLERFEARIKTFGLVFGADVIDVALAACDEALFELGAETERERLYVKERCLLAVAEQFKAKADELSVQRDVLDLRHTGPAEMWYCRCPDGRGGHRIRVIPRCAECGQVAPWAEQR